MVGVFEALLPHRETLQRYVIDNSDTTVMTFYWYRLIPSHKGGVFLYSLAFPEVLGCGSITISIFQDRPSPRENTNK